MLCSSRRDRSRAPSDSSRATSVCARRLRAPPRRPRGTPLVIQRGAIVLTVRRTRARSASIARSARYVCATSLNEAACASTSVARLDRAARADAWASSETTPHRKSAPTSRAFAVAPATLGNTLLAWAPRRSHFAIDRRRGFLERALLRQSSRVHLDAVVLRSARAMRSSASHRKTPSHSPAPAPRRAAVVRSIALLNAAARKAMSDHRPHQAPRRDQCPERVASF